MAGEMGFIYLGEKLATLAKEQAEWSQATFGTDQERGPIGALKHLAREVQECLESPADPMEHADCLLLILDASRRAGIGVVELLRVSQAKLDICKNRKWPTPIDDTPVEHVREPSAG